MREEERAIEEKTEVGEREVVVEKNAQLTIHGQTLFFR